MKAIWISFRHMLRFVSRDMMLLAAGLAPILAGIAIRFVVPLGEIMLIEMTGMSCVLQPYYGLFDVFYASIAPVMFCFVSAMVMLEERDDHIDRYLMVTELGYGGYVISRIVLPGIAAFLVTGVLLPMFKLIVMSFVMMVLLALPGALQGIIIALLIVTISSNKLEGMAVTKLSTLIIMGAVVPYFVPKPVCYVFSFLPSYWMGYGAQTENWVWMIPGIFVAAIWVLVFYRRYAK